MLTLKLWKLLKKVKKNWSHELKCTTTATKMKAAKVRAEPKTIGTADVNASPMLPRHYHLSDKVNVLFEPCHARWFCRHFQKCFPGCSVAYKKLSLQLNCDFWSTCPYFWQHDLSASALKNKQFVSTDFQKNNKTSIQ